MATTYKFTSKVWLYPGETANWHFVSVPIEKGEKIKKKFGANARGWGSLPVLVTIGTTTWKTSIFPDKVSGSYLLPLKAAVRKEEDILEGDVVAVSLQITA